MDAEGRKGLEEAALEWAERERYWARRLGRLRLGAEPIGEQLARFRNATIGLTAVSAIIGLMFLGLFAAFRHVVVGAWVVAFVLGPIVTFAWIDFLRLERLARRYERERKVHETRIAR